MEIGGGGVVTNTGGGSGVCASVSVCVCVCVKGGDERGVPHRSAGVRVATRQTVNIEKYNAYTSAVLTGESDAFIILIRMI